MNETASWSVTLWNGVLLESASICRLNSSSGFLLDSRIPLFTSRGSLRLKMQQDGYLATTQQPTQSHMHPSTSKGTPSWIEPRPASHRSFFNVLNAITASLLRGKSLQCKRGPSFLQNLGIYLAQYENRPDTLSALLHMSVQVGPVELADFSGSGLICRLPGNQASLVQLREISTFLH